MHPPSIFMWCQYATCYDSSDCFIGPEIDSVMKLSMVWLRLRVFQKKVQLKPLQKRVEMKTLLSKKVNIPHVYRSIMGWIMKLCIALSSCFSFWFKSQCFLAEEKGVPAFWLNAMKNHEILAEEVGEVMHLCAIFSLRELSILVPTYFPFVHKPFFCWLEIILLLPFSDPGEGWGSSQVPEGHQVVQDQRTQGF